MSPSEPNDEPIHEILRRRRSPYGFDPSRTIAIGDLRALFEAARWTMSSYNEQPWRYIVGIRDQDTRLWEQVLSVLVEGNQAWARHAPVLALGLAKHPFERNGKPNKAAVHDLGAASASLTFEATARGLSVHQMIGIEPEKARELFALDEGLEPYTGIAIGYAGHPPTLDPKYSERDGEARHRKPLSEILVRGW